MHRKFGEVWNCVAWYTLADRETDGRTGTLITIHVLRSSTGVEQLCYLVPASNANAHYVHFLAYRWSLERLQQFVLFKLISYFFEQRSMSCGAAVTLPWCWNHDTSVKYSLTYLMINLKTTALFISFYHTVLSLCSSVIVLPAYILQNSYTCIQQLSRRYNKLENNV